MTKIASTTALCAMLLTLGCDDGRGGGRDAGGIVLMDSGPGGGTDAGPGMGTDAGPGMMGGCSVAGATGFPPLPASCLPRCSAATAMAVNACGANAMCQQTAMEGDTTAPVNVDVGMGMSESIDCFGCFNWMINSCLFDSCPDELGACVMCADLCDDSMAGCETEEGAFDACIMGNMAAIQSCVNTRATGCFATGGGFLPTLDRPQLQLPPEVYERTLRNLGVRLPL